MIDHVFDVGVDHCLGFILIIIASWGCQYLHGMPWDDEVTLVRRNEGHAHIYMVPESNEILMFVYLQTDNVQYVTLQCMILLIFLSMTMQNIEKNPALGDSSILILASFLRQPNIKISST